MTDRASMERALARISERCRAAKSSSEWQAMASASISYFEALEASWPEPFKDSALWAAREWSRLIQAGTMSEDSIGGLVRYAFNNKTRGMPWRQLASDIGHWLYSNGHDSALTLHFHYDHIRSILARVEGAA